VLRRQAGETHHVVAERGDKTIVISDGPSLLKPTPRPPPPEPLIVAREWPPDPEPRPTSEQRAYFWRLTFQGCYWLVIISMLALAGCAMLFVAVVKTAGG
jgi:hypothetical protein